MQVIQTPESLPLAVRAVFDPGLQKVERSGASRQGWP